jgi:hypothetical protein
MFFDDWFYVRNTYASLIHVHATSASLRASSARWLPPVLRRTPLIVSIYPGEDDGDTSRAATVEVRRGGQRLSRGTVDLTGLRDANWLYDAILNHPRA